MIGTTLNDPAVRACFELGVRSRFMSVLLSPPEVGRQEALRELAAQLMRQGESDLRALTGPGDDEVRKEAFRLLGQAGQVSECASDYVDGGYADKGPILADIAGFYHAFGFTPGIGENPDHFASLFEFLSFLDLKAAWALMEGDEEQAEIAREAGEKLVLDHMTPYLARFADKLAERAHPGGAYEEVARRLVELAALWQRAPVETNEPMKEEL